MVPSGVLGAPPALRRDIGVRAPAASPPGLDLAPPSGDFLGSVSRADAGARGDAIRGVPPRMAVPPARGDPDGPHHASSRRDAARVSCGPPGAHLSAGHRRNLSQRLKRKPFRVLETPQDSTTSRAGKTTRASTLRALSPAPAAASPGCSRNQRRASAHLSSRGRRWCSRSSPSPTPPRRGTQPPSRRRGPPRRALKSRRGSAVPWASPRRPRAREARVAHHARPRPQPCGGTAPSASCAHTRERQGAGVLRTPRSSSVTLDGEDARVAPAFNGVPAFFVDVRAARRRRAAERRPRCGRARR